MTVLTPPYDLPDLRPFRVINHRMRLAGGAVVTENGVLQSEDYVPGVSGWCIFGDGTVEFNDGIFRGEIDATGLNITITEADDGAIEFYNTADELVGRLSPTSWEIGDLTTPGLRATLDPLGGLRFRSVDDELLTLIDQLGLTIRDAESGVKVTEVGKGELRLVDEDGGHEILFSTHGHETLLTPRYTAGKENNPGTSLVVPAAELLGTNDIELGHVSSWRRGTVQATTHTPPGGWTEVVDEDTGAASTLATSTARRAVATGTSGTFTSSQGTWDNAIGSHVIVKGTEGGTTPSVRSSTTDASETSLSTATLSIDKPTGTVAGDVLVLFVAMGNSGGSVPLGWATPEGWTFLGAQLSIITSPLSTHAVGVWAKLATASEPSTYETSVTFGLGTKTLHATLVCIQDADLIPGLPQFSIGGQNLAGNWNDYTPSNSNITVGNGTQTAAYLLMGKTCFFRWHLVLGSTTSFGGVVEVGLPFTASAFAQQSVFGGLYDATTFLYRLLGGNIPASATRALLIHTEGGASFGRVTNGASPHAWTTGDELWLTGMYEIA